MSLFTAVRGARRASASSLAVLVLLSLPGPTALSQKQAQPPAQQPGGEKDAQSAFQAMSQGHAEFRRAVLAEFHRVATRRNQQMDFPSLIITSCNDTCMLAGVATSREPSKPADRKPDDPRPTASTLDTHEPLGLVAVAGSFLSVRSRLIDASGPSGQVQGREVAPVGLVKLQPGFYVVRRGPRPNLLELVDLDDKVAVTLLFQPGHPGRAEGGGPGEHAPRGAPDRNDDLGDASEWPTIFMELLHAVDLSVHR